MLFDFFVFFFDQRENVQYIQINVFISDLGAKGSILPTCLPTYLPNKPSYRYLEGDMIIAYTTKRLPFFPPSLPLLRLLLRTLPLITNITIYIISDGICDSAECTHEIATIVA